MVGSKITTLRHMGAKDGAAGAHNMSGVGEELW
jgi:hypothetical protein